MEAVIEERSEANKKYDDAVKAGTQAWKLEKVTDDVFQIALGNAAPNTTIII